ncbi:hypothetical protein [Citromicrobium bathyomarinum]|uniref:hypothetical protein n=1 Tax=Citromicrobium bathyomarinum TaxID=72174 RepID=UPI001E4D1E8D|nr:hypothetical protein [Citromicrobium bathyomarinum]MCD1623679.1 hypothetical protein [Citromicrobium bathyomarinum]
MSSNWIGDVAGAINTVMGAIFGAFLGVMSAQVAFEQSGIDVVIACGFLTVSIIFIQVVMKWPIEKAGWKYLLPVIGFLFFAFLPNQMLNHSFGENAAGNIVAILMIWFF